MDWSWLTPPIAAALAGGMTALAAIIGVIVTGFVNRRTAREQFEVQREIALKQLESQERNAEAARAEGRALALVAEKRARYSKLLADIDDARLHLVQAAKRAGTSSRHLQSMTRNDLMMYWLARDQIGSNLASIRIISSKEVMTIGHSLLRHLPPPHDLYEADENAFDALLSFLSSHNQALIEACQSDLREDEQ